VQPNGQIRVKKVEARSPKSPSDGFLGGDRRQRGITQLKPSFVIEMRTMPALHRDRKTKLHIVGIPLREGSPPQIVEEVHVDALMHIRSIVVEDQQASLSG
jgi:hypothetical protein